MARSIDVAVAFLEKSIEMAEKERNPEYYMDFVKLNGLMVIGQIYYMAYYEERLFSESIILEKDCPYPRVEGIGHIPGTFGFGEIKPNNPKNEKKFIKNKLITDTYIFPPSAIRMICIEYILNEYGKCSTLDIIKFIKDIMTSEESYYFLNKCAEIEPIKLSDYYLKAIGLRVNPIGDSYLPYYRKGSMRYKIKRKKKNYL